MNCCGDFYQALCLEMVKAVLGEEAAKKFKRIPLSDNVICNNRIDDIGADILDQVVSDIKASSTKISVQ